MVVLGLGRYFGGGLMITPGASPQAGHFQVVLGQKLSRLELLTLLPGLYFGKHLDHPRVTADYAGHIKIDADPPAYVEAEGELEGLTPIEVAIIPRALRIAAPSLSTYCFSGPEALAAFSDPEHSLKLATEVFLAPSSLYSKILP